MATTSIPVQPSGKIPVWGVYLLILVSLVATLALGAIYALLAREGDLLIFGPLIAGILLGFVFKWAVKLAHCRNPRLVLAIAAFSGILLIGSRLYFQSLDMYVNLMPDSIAKEDHISREEAREEVKQFQTEKGLVGSFVAYMQMTAENGVTLGHSGSYSSDQEKKSDISGLGYYLLLLLKFVIATFTVVAVASDSYKPGYCESCHRWYTTQKLGMADPLARDTLLAAVGRHDWATLAQLQHPVVRQKKGTSYLLTQLHSCKGCNDGYLEAIERISEKNREQKVTLGIEVLTKEDVVAVSAIKA